MRLILILALILIVGPLTIRADTLVVTGVLLNPDKSRAGGYRVKIYAGGRGAGDATDSTSAFGVYTIVKENVDAGTISSWQLVCNENNKKAYSRLAFERKPNNIWQAKVEDISLVSTDQARYTVNEASEVIYVVTAVQATKANSGELTAEQANELAAAESALVLGHTELGLDPEATLRRIHNEVRLRSNPGLLTLPMLRADKFLLLRDRAEFRDSRAPSAVIDPPSVKPPLSLQSPLIKPDRTSGAFVYSRVGPGADVEGGNKRCETVTGKTREE
jgi:hypothetical protein